MLGLIRFLFLLTSNMVLATFQYYSCALPYRKGSESLRSALKMTICKTGLQLSVKSARHVNLYSNSTLVRRIMKFIHSALVGSLPGYGEQFDEHAIWLVKHENISYDSPIMIYMHGGGYYMQTVPQQLGIVLSIYKLTSARVQAKLNIMLLDYKLACNGYPVPTQLNQLFETYSSLISQGYTNICFFGDSAGANLSISFSQLLFHYFNKIPHPITDPLPPLKNNIPHIYPKTQILISPWVKIKPSPEQGATLGMSWHDNEPYDIIQFSNPFDYTDIVSSSLHLSDIMVSPGNHGYEKPNEWLRIPSFQTGSSVLVICGEDESFRDDILEWCAYALDVPLGSVKSDGNYHYTRENSKDSANAYVFMEPKGIHDSLFFLEDGIIRKMNNNKELTYDQLDPEKYFGVVRIAIFLDTVI